MSQPAAPSPPLKAADGHTLEAYRATPAGRPRGGVVVLQEIFGVTRHIRDVADQYAAQGYLAIAPALFDRVERGAERPYDDVAGSRALVERLNPAQTLTDVKAAIDAAAAAGKVGVVGFCWGGTLAYLAACHLPAVSALRAAVSYYGGRLPQYLDRTPKCPAMFHFGEKDAHIPAADVERVKRAFPLGHYYLYPADHGFACPDRAAYDAASARLAFDRSVDFLLRHVG